MPRHVAGVTLTNTDASTTLGRAHLDACGLAVELECATWRVDCPHCGVTTESAP
jgi:hypothetical protein